MRTFKRKIVDIDTKVNNISKYSNQLEFTGIVEDSNIFAVDQKSQSDALNVYVNGDGQLVSREPLVEDEALSEIIGSGELIEIKEVRDITIYVIKNNYSYTLITKVGEDTYTTSCGNKYHLTTYDKYIVCFNTADSVVFDINNPTSGWKSITEYAEIPITKITTGFDVEERNKNEFTNKYKERYIRTNAIKTLIPVPPINSTLLYNVKTNYGEFLVGERTHHYRYDDYKFNEAVDYRVNKPFNIEIDSSTQMSFAITETGVRVVAAASYLQNTLHLSLDGGETFSLIILPKQAWQNTNFIGTLSEDGLYFFYTAQDPNWPKRCILYKYNIVDNVWTTGSALNAWGNTQSLPAYHFISGDRYVIAHRNTNNSLLFSGMSGSETLYWEAYGDSAHIKDYKFAYELDLGLSQYGAETILDFDNMRRNSIRLLYNPYRKIDEMIGVMVNNSDNSVSLTNKGIIIHSNHSDGLISLETETNECFLSLVNVSYVGTDTSSVGTTTSFNIEAIRYNGDMFETVSGKCDSKDLTAGGGTHSLTTYGLERTVISIMPGSCESLREVYLRMPIKITDNVYINAESYLGYNNGSDTNEIGFYDGASADLNIHSGLTGSKPNQFRIMINNGCYVVWGNKYSGNYGSYTSKSMQATNMFNDTDQIIATITYNAYNNQGETVVPADKYTKVPNLSYSGSQLYLAFDNTLRITNNIKNGDDVKFSLDKINDQSFGQNISGLINISTSELAIFFEHGITICSKVEDEIYGYRYDYNKTRLSLGIRLGDDVINTLDGSSTVFPTTRGLAIMNYQAYMATTDQVLEFISDKIGQIWREFYIKGNIKLLQMKNYIYITNGTNEYLMLDTRSMSWWKFKVPYNITRLITDQNILRLISKRLYVFDNAYNKNRYFDDENKTIDWYVASQRLHFNAINHYKNLKQLIFQFAQANNFKNTINTVIKLYRKVITYKEPELIEFKIDEYRTFVKRFNYWKINEVQWGLSNDTETAIPAQLILNGIDIKYEIGEEVR